MSESTLRVNLVGDATSLNRSLRIANERLGAFGKRATEVGKRLSVALTLPIGVAAGAAIKMASDMEESTNKVRVAFGSSSKSVEAFAKTSLRSFGIAESSALDMTALFGDMATGMGISQAQAAGLSTELVALAGDLASFKNINIEEVTTALSGVFTGETESLKRLGIVMTEVNLEQFRLNEGINKSVKEMTQQEKIMLRLRYVLSVTKNAQGDFARTSEGAANQMRIFQESIKEVGAELGSIMLPAFNNIITKVNELLDDFRNLDKGTQESIVNFGLMVAAIPPLVFAIGQITTAVKALNAAFLALSAAKLTGPIAALLGILTLSGDVRDETALLTEIEIDLINFENSLEEQERKAQETAKAVDKLIREDLGVPTVKPDAPVLFTAEQLANLEAEIDLFSDQMEYADAVASKFGIERMNAVDTGFGLILAQDAAAVEYFGNTIERVAEDVRTPMEIIEEKFKDLSEASVNMVMQIGSSLTSAFNNMLNGENVFESLAKSLGALIKRLIAAAAAAAILSAFLGGTPALEFLGGFKGIFGSLSGLGSFAPGSAIGAPRGSGLGMGNLGIQGAMRSDNINLSGQFRIDGQDLVVAVERANNQRSNFTG